MNKLNIRSYGMLAPIGTVGAASSWCYTIHHLAQSFIKSGHQLYLNTTNGIQGVPKNLLKYMRDCPNPDIEFVYCTPNNWPHRFISTTSNTKRAKIRCGILNYESSMLPQDWAQYHKYLDFILPSSEYCEDIFIKAGIPKEKIVVMPLGVDFDVLNAPLDDVRLKTKKKFKLLNVSINHTRKNIPLLIESYLEEFSANDDICLVIKTSLAPKKDVFEIDVRTELNAIIAKYQNKSLPEIEVVEHRFNNIASLYKQCDGLICVSSSEGWFLPGLEGMYCGNLVASPRYGGQLDYLEHNKNCLLIDTIEVRAPNEYQYWQAHPSAVIGLPIKDSIKSTMRKMYENCDELKNTFRKNMRDSVLSYTWDNSAQIILDLYEGKKPKQIYGELL